MNKREAPLRKVIGSDELGREILECGHKLFPPKDWAGFTAANRRRCWKCYKEGTTVDNQHPLSH